MVSISRTQWLTPKQSRLMTLPLPSSSSDPSASSPLWLSFIMFYYDLCSSLEVLAFFPVCLKQIKVLMRTHLILNPCLSAKPSHCQSQPKKMSKWTETCMILWAQGVSRFVTTLKALDWVSRIRKRLTQQYDNNKKDFSFNDFKLYNTSYTVYISCLYTIIYSTLG